MSCRAWGSDEPAWGLALEAERLGNDADDGGDEVLCRVFLGCSKCPERVPLRQLDERAVAAGAPDRLLALALQIYT